MPAATVRIIVSITGAPGVTALAVEPTAQSFGSAVGELEYVDLASGANTITRPTQPNSATGLLIIPPTANAQTILLKGVSGDTGISLSMTTPTWIAFNTASPPATIVLTAGGTINACMLVWL